MTSSIPPLVVAILAVALGGCASTVDRYGSSSVGVGPFAFCEPAGSLIDWAPGNVPGLRAAERRDLEPRSVDVPELRSLRGTLELGGGLTYAPDLLAPQRPDIPARASDPLIELPPTRGAPSLPATTLDVPALAARERPDFAAQPTPPPDLGAPARPRDVGFANEPATNDTRACNRYLVLASISCRLPARADLREPAGRTP